MHHSGGFFMFLLNQTDRLLQTSPLRPWTPESGSRKQGTEVWQEQKQLWEACLYWLVATVTVERAGKKSPGALLGVEKAKFLSVIVFYFSWRRVCICSVLSY